MSVPKKVLQMYSDIWFPDFDSEKWLSSLLSMRLNWKRKQNKGHFVAADKSTTKAEAPDVSPSGADTMLGPWSRASIIINKLGRVGEIVQVSPRHSPILVQRDRERAEVVHECVFSKNNHTAS